MVKLQILSISTFQKKNKYYSVDDNIYFSDFQYTLTKYPTNIFHIQLPNISFNSIDHS